MPSVSARSWVSSKSLLKVGSKGKQVKQLENLLKKQGLKVGKVDGKFDRDTFEAVRKYQSAKGLQVDGIVGQQTWGSFKGLKLKAGSDLLGKAGRSHGGAKKGGGKAHGHDHGHAGHSHGPGHDHTTTGERPGRVPNSVRNGPGKPVTAYVNGRAQRIKVVSVGEGEYMRADAARNFKAMQAAARRAGVNLSATSGFRTMSEQRHLYNLYKSGRGNLAAPPGHSNHQNGISMDIGGVNGYSTRAYSWLKNNARRFGFVNDVAGEYWHWTYRG